MKTELIVLASAGAFSLAAVGATLTGIGPLRATAVSGDGLWVVGDDGRDAVRWSARTGITRLGHLPGAIESSAYAVSADGRYVAGDSDDRGFIWSDDGGIRELEKLPGTSFTSPWGISSDGKTIVGGTEIERGEEDGPPFRWHLGSGTAVLGHLVGANRGEGLAISDDGTVVVGWSGSEDLVEAFRFGRDGVMKGLGTLPGFVDSVARGVSDDGATVVGECGNEANDQAFRWTNNDGMQSLGELPGFRRTSAKGVSQTGDRVVGDAETNDGSRRAFIWDARRGIRTLQAALEDEHGLGLDGWILERAVGISGNGRVIVGRGISGKGLEEAWMVDLTPAQVALTAVRGASSVIITWPRAAGAYELEWRNALATDDSWSLPSTPPTLAGTQWVVTNATTSLSIFHRLKFQ